MCHRNPCRRNMRVTTSSRRPSSFLALLALVAVCRQMMAAVACRWQPVSASRMPWRIMQSISTLISSVHSSRFEVSVLASLDRSGSLPMAAAMPNGCSCWHQGLSAALAAVLRSEWGSSKLLLLSPPAALASSPGKLLLMQRD